MSDKTAYDDIVHGPIKLACYIQIIIETPHFQRLKNIHQLGLAFKIFKSASHNRYDHCIGTYHLAEKMLGTLAENGKMEIPMHLWKAVSVAALLHDISHGPFSHTWENLVHHSYKHEERAKDCIHQIFQIDRVKQTVFADFKSDITTDYFVNLVNSFIIGDRNFLKDKKYQFLYDIVNNTHCKVDVDKWDYLLRDAHYIKKEMTIPVDLDFEDVFLKARPSEDFTKVEYRYCDFRKLYNIFHARFNFHLKFYREPRIELLEKILERVLDLVKLDIDGIELQQIRSCDESTFLKFHDDTIWNCLDNIDRPGAQVPEDAVKLANFLLNIDTSKIKKIDPNSYEQKPKFSFATKFEMKGPGSEMQKNKMSFYGDVDNKPEFQMDEGHYKQVQYFQLEL